MLEPLTQFGVAGLMGGLWTWERMLSRRREQQLDKAHARITAEREHIDLLFRVVNRNNRALERLIASQDRLQATLERIHDELNKHDA